MKTIVSTALVTMVLAAGATAAGTKLIDGHLLKNGSVPASKLTKQARVALHGTRGPRGLPGTAGPLVRGVPPAFRGRRGTRERPARPECPALLVDWLVTSGQRARTPT
jgi:hypothetical protein